MYFTMVLINTNTLKQINPKFKQSNQNSTLQSKINATKVLKKIRKRGIDYIKEKQIDAFGIKTCLDFELWLQFLSKGFFFQNHLCISGFYDTALQLISLQDYAVPQSYRPGIFADLPFSFHSFLIPQIYTYDTLFWHGPLRFAEISRQHISSFTSNNIVFKKG